MPSMTTNSRTMRAKKTKVLAAGQEGDGPPVKPLSSEPNRKAGRPGWTRGTDNGGLLVSGQAPEIQVDENGSVNIPCKAYQSGAKRTEWKFKRGDNTVLFYHDGEFTDSYKGRATFYPTEIHLASVTRQDTGLYTCEVLRDNANGLASSMVDLVVKVPPSKPLAEVPSTAIIGNKAVLTCLETDGSPRPTFSWFKNNLPMPVDPKTSSQFKNSSYSLDPKTGVLTFLPLTPYDAGDYYCEASNNVGTPQKSDVMHLEPTEINVGAIVAAVVVILLILGLVAFGIWFAFRRGYFSKRNTTNKKVIYSQPSTRSDGEFKQTSSFLV